MKTNELRIGNWVLSCSEGIETKVGMIAVGIDIHFKPIPLTEEWLLNFGFEKRIDCINSLYCILAGRVLLEYDFRYNTIDMINRVNFHIDIHIQYVHQLQNLYFALTGEELTITK